MLRRSLRLKASWFMLFLAGAFMTPVEAHAHIRLDESSPAPGEVVSAMPLHLRLLFSARIEARYTRVTLTAPDGALVPTEDVVFVDGSDREITLRLRSPGQPGTYTVRWRTAGADGHVLEGSYAFVVAADSAADRLSRDTTRNGGAGDRDTVRTAIGAASDDDPHGHHAEAEPVGAVRDAIGRGLHFVALLLLLGGVAFRGLLMPRLGLTPATSIVLRRRTWRLIATAAVLLALAAILRLWFQSISLHGSERAWNSELLSIMLTDTAWGRGWLLQAFLFAVLGMAIVWARHGRDRAAVIVAVIAVLGLSAIPALTGHAAGATGLGRLIVLNDALHVVGAGAWLGTLALLILVAIPVIRRRETNGDVRAADAIDSFSPLALTAGATVIATGLVNSLVHLTALSQLWTTSYGRVLIIKLMFVGSVALAGLVNWRMVRPRLRELGGLRRLRLASAAELSFAFLVLAVTAVLTGLPRP